MCSIKLSFTTFMYINLYWTYWSLTLNHQFFYNMLWVFKWNSWCVSVFCLATWQTSPFLNILKWVFLFYVQHLQGALNIWCPSSFWVLSEKRERRVVWLYWQLIYWVLANNFLCNLNIFLTICEFWFYIYACFFSFNVKT